MDFDRYRDVSDNRAHIVGTLKPNGYGIFDMHGNVWEWCRDLYGPYSSEDKKDPKGPPRGSFRVLRGGAWSSSPKECSSWYRHHAERTASLKTSGFRLIKIT